MPENEQVQQDNQQIQDPPYRKKVYDLLANNFSDFKTSEAEFNSKLDTDKEYAGKVYDVLSKSFSDFKRPKEEFFTMLSNDSEKKNSGVTSEPESGVGSQSQSQSPSAPKTVKEAIDLYKSLSDERTKADEVTKPVSAGTGAPGTSAFYDKTNLNKLESDFKGTGYDEKDIKDLASLPSWAVNDQSKTTSPEQMLWYKKNFPLLYDKAAAIIKNRDMLVKANGGHESDADLAYNDLSGENISSLGQLEANVAKSKKIVADALPSMPEVEEAYKNIATDKGFYVSKFLPGVAEAGKEMNASALGLDDDQVAGLQYLRVFDPKKYESTLNTLKAVITPQYEGTVDYDITSGITNAREVETQASIDKRRGVEMVRKSLLTQGRQNAMSVANQNLYNISQEAQGLKDSQDPKSIAKLSELKEKADYWNGQIDAIKASVAGDADKFPLIHETEETKRAKEVLNDPGFNPIEYALGSGANKIVSVGHGIENAAISLLGSEEDKAINAAKRAGEGLRDEATFYMPRSTSQYQTDLIPVANQTAQKKIDEIKNSGAPADDQIKQVIELMKNNPEDIKWADNPDAGKKAGFFTMASVYSNMKTIGDIAALSGLTLVTGGLGASEMAASMIPFYLDTQSESFKSRLLQGESYDQANAGSVKDGIVVSLAAAVAPQLDVVKTALGKGGNKYLQEFVAGIDEAEWKTIVEKEAPMVTRMTNSLKAVGKEAATMAGVYGGGTTAVQGLTEGLVTGNRKSNEQILDDSLMASWDMLTSSAALLGIGAIKNFKYIGPETKRQLLVMAQDPNKAIAYFSELQKTGKITPEQAQQKMSVVRQMADLESDVPVVNPNGKRIGDDERAGMLVRKFLQTKADEYAKNAPKQTAEELKNASAEMDQQNHEVLNGKKENDLYATNKSTEQGNATEGGELKHQGVNGSEQEQIQTEKSQADNSNSDTRGEGQVAGQELSKIDINTIKESIPTNTKETVDNIKNVETSKEDGATFNLDGTKYEGGGLVVPVDSMNTTQDKITPEMIRDFVEKNGSKLSSDQFKVGIYKFPDSNQVSIDLNIVVDHKHRDVALEFAKRAGQESLFDLSNFENVKTGATGESPKTFTDEQFAEIAKSLSQGQMPKSILDESRLTELRRAHAKSNAVENANVIANAARALQTKWQRIDPNIGVRIEDYNDTLEANKNNGTMSEAEYNAAKRAKGYFDPSTNTVHLNAERFTPDTPIHEFGHVWFGLMNKYNPDLIAKGMDLITVDRKDNGDGTQTVYVRHNNGDSAPFKLNKVYHDLSDNDIKEEYLVSLIGKKGAEISDTRSGFQQWVNEVIDYIKNKLGIAGDWDKLTVNDFVKLGAEDVLSGGKKTGIKRATPSEVAENSATSADISTKEINLQNTEDVFNNKLKLQGDFDSELFADSDEFNKLVEDGYIQHDVPVASIEGKTVAISNPDNFAVGDIYFRGKKIAEGDGGLHFVQKYGDVWASAKKSSANSLANLINESIKNSDDGVGRLVLVKSDETKNVTSVKGAKAAMNLIEKLADDGDIPLRVLRKSLTAVGKKYGVEFNGKDDAKSIHADIQAKFMNASESSFEGRGYFVKDLVDDIAKNYDMPKETVNKLAASFGYDKKMNKFNWTAVEQTIGAATTERVLRGIPSGYAYAVIETKSPVKVKEGSHESYPYHIVTEDGSRPVTKILSDRKHYKDLFIAAKDTEKVKEGSRFNNPAEAGLAQRGMNLAKVDLKFQHGEDLVEEAGQRKHMTEDENGNYIFYHYSDKKFNKTSPDKFGGNTRATGRDENPGIGMTMFYTRPDARESNVPSDYGYAVRVPKDKVYPFNTDPLNLLPRAEKLFREQYGNDAAFDPNKQVAFVAKVAGEKGFPMTVAEWGKKELAIRAQSTEPMSVEKYSRIKPGTTNQVEVDEGLSAYKPNAKRRDLKFAAIDDKNYSFVKQSLIDGYRPEEISQILQEDGYTKAEADKLVGDIAEPYVTSVKNATVREERAARNLAMVQKAGKETYQQSFDQAKDLVDRGLLRPRDPNNPSKGLVAQLLKNPRPISAVESAALLYDRARLANERDRALEGIEEAQKLNDKDLEASYMIDLGIIESDIDANDHAVTYAGTEIGRALAARKMLLAQDYSLANLERRAKAAKGGKPLTADDQALIKELSDKVQKLTAKLEAHENKASKNAMDNAVNEAKKNVSQKAQPKEVFIAKKSSILERLKTAMGKEGSSGEKKFSIADELPKEAKGIMKELFQAYIEAGETDPNTISASIHNDVKDIIDNVSERDVRDLISGYGEAKQLNADELNVAMRDVKAQMRLISAIEDVENNQRPLKSGLQRDEPSDEVRRLRQELEDKMKQADFQDEDSDKAYKSALDGIKKRLANQIKDLENQIATGERREPNKGVEYDQEATDLKAERDRLKAIVDEIDKENGADYAKKVAAAERAIKRNISKLQEKIAKGDVNPEEKAAQVTSEHLEYLRNIQKSYREDLTKMQEEAGVIEKQKIERYKKTLETRKKGYEEKLAKGDFAKPEKKNTVLDDEAIRLKKEVEDAKYKFEKARAKWEKDNDSKLQKAVDKVIKFHRSVLLSSITTLGKIGTAGTWLLATKPLEEAAGSALKLVPGLNKIAEGAAREGRGFSPKIEAQALADLFTKTVTGESGEQVNQTIHDLKRIMSGQKGTIETAYGKRIVSPEEQDFFGQLHAAIKYLPKQNEINRSMAMRFEAAAKNGEDISSPSVQARVISEALIDGNRTIFMGENAVVDAYKAALRALENKGGGSKALANVMKFLIPIVKVPTNYVKSTGEYLAGAVPATYKIIEKGVDGLSASEKDTVMRLLKKQSVGLAFFALGFFGAGSIGGYYTGEKRKEGDVKEGELNVFGVHVPKWMTHAPVIEVMQFAATVRRLVDSQKESGEKPTYIKNTAEAAGELVGEVPFFGLAGDINEAAKSEKAFNKLAANQVTSTIVPPDVKKMIKGEGPLGTIASKTGLYKGDLNEEGEVNKRRAISFIDQIEANIPGLRETLPMEHKPVRDAAREKLEDFVRKGGNIKAADPKLLEEAELRPSSINQFVKEAKLPESIKSFKDAQAEKQLKLWSTYGDAKKAEVAKYLKTTNAFQTLMEDKPELMKDYEKVYNNILNENKKHKR